MAIQARFTKENDTYFLVNQTSKTPVPTHYFKIFYDAILNKLEKNNCLNEIKPEIVMLCKKRVDKEFTALEETVNLIFYLTLQLRRDFADELLRDNNYTFNEFDLFYQLKLMQHKLPFPEHDIFNSKKVLKYLGEPDFLEEIEIAAMDQWKQQNPEIANSEVLYKRVKDTQQYLILQQIIQYYMKIEIETYNKVDSFFVRIQTANRIKTIDFLNKLPNMDERILRRVAETKKIMFPIPRVKRNLEIEPATFAERESKRVHVEREERVATEARVRNAMVDPAAFIDLHFGDLKRLGMHEGRLHLYYNFTAQWGSYNEVYFSQKLRDKFTQVVKEETERFHPHLQSVVPVIERKNYKELDLFLQKMIQWELTLSQNTHVVVAKIMSALENSSLPYLSIFSKRSIKNRVEETKEFYNSR